MSVYDAFGKMGSNVEGGNTNQPGLLKECRSAHGPTFSGQYCQVFLRQVTTTTNIIVGDKMSSGQADLIFNKVFLFFLLPYREQSSTLWVFVFLTPAGKQM